jgi:UMP-CMP kinase
MPVVEDFRAKDKVVEVKADTSVKEVYAKIKAGIEKRGIEAR